MKKPTYHMTATAEAQFLHAILETHEKWGIRQAYKYRDSFLSGLQELAENYKNFITHYREELTKGTDFHAHLIEHRYVVYQAYDDRSILIVAIFYGRMDVPKRLKEIMEMSRDEIAQLKEKIRQQESMMRYV